MDTHRKTIPYLPNERNFSEPSTEDLRCYSPSGDFTNLPNPFTDPIVSNNISTSEFDYTENLIFKTSKIIK